MAEDPRTYFSAERTLLAWTRTAVTVMGLGFVVARFGLFLRALRGEAVRAHPVSQWLGIVLVLLGSAIAMSSALQFRGFVSTLPAEALPRRYRVGFAYIVNLVLCVAAVVLAVHLFLTR